MFYDFDSNYASLNGYAGLKTNLTNNIAIYLLGTSFVDFDGMVAGPSIWFESESFFAEASYYVSVAKSDPENEGLYEQYYGFAEYSYYFNDDAGIGLAFETMGAIEDPDPFQLAYGPVIYIDRFSLWALYDHTPMDEGDLVGLRLRISFD